MAEQNTQFLMYEDERIQADPVCLSRHEDTETQCHLSGRDLTNDHNDCWLNQVLIHLNDPTDTVQVTISIYDLDMPILSHSATTDSQQGRNMHNVSQVFDDVFSQSGLHPIELRQVIPTKDSPESPTPSNKRPTQLFKPYDLPNTPHCATILNNAKLKQAPRNSNNWVYTPTQKYRNKPQGV